MTEVSQTERVPNILERLLDDVFQSIPRLRYEKARDDNPPSVVYNIFTKPEADIKLSFELTSDILYVEFAECYLMAERARWEGRKDRDAFDDWCQDCIQLVRGILESPEIKIVSMRDGGGGRLYRREGKKWICCGGEMFILFGKKKIYSDWY